MMYSLFLLGGCFVATPFWVAEAIIGGGFNGKRRWGLMLPLAAWSIYSWWVVC